MQESKETDKPSRATRAKRALKPSANTAVLSSIVVAGTGHTHLIGREL